MKCPAKPTTSMQGLNVMLSNDLLLIPRLSSPKRYLRATAQTIFYSSPSMAWTSADSETSSTLQRLFALLQEVTESWRGKTDDRQAELSRSRRPYTARPHHRLDRGVRRIFYNGGRSPSKFLMFKQIGGLGVQPPVGFGGNAPGRGLGAEPPQNFKGVEGSESVRHTWGQLESMKWSLTRSVKY